MKKFFNKNNKKKRDNEDDDQSATCPRVKITKVDDSAMDIDYSSRHPSLTPSPSPSSLCPSPSPSYLDQQYSCSQEVITTATSQDCYEVSSELKKMNLENSWNFS